MSSRTTRNVNKKYSDYKVTKRARCEDKDHEVKKHPINPNLAITKESECLSCLGR